MNIDERRAHYAALVASMLEKMPHSLTPKMAREYLKANKPTDAQESWNYSNIWDDAVRQGIRDFANRPKPDPIETAELNLSMDLMEQDGLY